MTKPAKPKWPADQVTPWPIEKLKAYERNARTHSEAQIAQIAASIKEWGWTMPVLATKAGRIIAGHGRVEAAKLLGLETVPVMIAEGWTAEQVRAYTIADNKLALNAGWDFEALSVELSALGELGMDTLLTGFAPHELAGLLDHQAGPTDPEKEWDDMPEFSQEDQTAFRRLIINFANEAAVNDFARLIDQHITDKTRSIWHPAAEIGTTADKRYASDSTLPDLHS